jgi:tRNA (guanine-N7-)-methyltransferase
LENVWAFKDGHGFLLNPPSPFPSIIIYFNFMARGRHPTRIHISLPDEQTRAKYLVCWYGRDLHNDPHRFPGLTSSEMFGNNKPLEIDFGCGTGVLACGRARQFPEVNIIGIDRSQKPLFCAIRDAVTWGLENIRFIRGNFHEMLPLLRPESVSAAYYLFPNPHKDYHKERANARRRHFLQSVHATLAPGGRFYFATDSSVFFECMNGILENDLKYKTLDPETAGPDICSGYRRLWEERGKSVKSFVLEKEVRIIK